MAKLSTSNIRHHDNLIINGDMRIAQRGTSFTSVSASQYTLDRWKYTDSGTTSSVVTVTQDTDVPTGEGFVSSLKIDVTTAESGSDADELQRLLQYVEAQNLQHVGHGTADAKELHLSWWFKSDNKTGTMCATILSHDAGDMLLKEFTVPDNNWNKYTWVIPANTDGGPANDTGQGFSIQFILNTGSNYHTTEKTTWTATVADYSTSNQANFLDNTSNNLWFTGVQLVAGNRETGFDFKTPGEQLALCQRYYERQTTLGAWRIFGTGGQISTTQSEIYSPFLNPKRSDSITASMPTVSNFLIQSAGPSTAVTSVSSAQSTHHGCFWKLNHAAIGAASQYAVLRDNNTASAYVDYDCEL
jgi:hypothetical protein